MNFDSTKLSTLSTINTRLQLASYYDQFKAPEKLLVTFYGTPQLPYVFLSH